MPTPHFSPFQIVFNVNKKFITVSGSRNRVSIKRFLEEIQWSFDEIEKRGSWFVYIYHDELIKILPDLKKALAKRKLES